MMFPDDLYWQFKEKSVTDWLSEIEDKNKKLGELTSSDGMGEITRMARVLRELGEAVDRAQKLAFASTVSNEYVGICLDVVESINNLSDDANELCVAARDE